VWAHPVAPISLIITVQRKIRILSDSKVVSNKVGATNTMLPVTCNLLLKVITKCNDAFLSNLTKVTS
jgi:uncharacterized protein YqgV (UPF0045/DUF77 family)